MPFKVIIPARHDSQRLPGKPLRLIAGKPMIQWVVEAAQQSAADQVWVATDHPDIRDCVAGFGARCIMTSATHTSGTDRLQEAAQQLKLKDSDCVVNVQGDEPLIPPAVINQVAENLQQQENYGVATLCEAISEQQEFADPNVVKVVFSAQGQALYFSRAPIPMQRDPSESAGQAFRHIGLYAYRVSMLHRFVAWPEHSLERSEKLEQLRVLANGVQIHVAESCQPIPGGVDCEADLVRVEKTLLASQ